VSTDLSTDGETPFAGDVAGQPVIMHYGDIAREYTALREGAMLVDRSFRGRMRVNGAKGPELITGMVTNDVLALRSGSGLYAAALSAKGKIVADPRIFALDDHLLVDVPPRAWPGWVALVHKYINPRLAPYSDVSSEIRDIGVFGRASRRIASAASGVAVEQLAALQPYHHVSVESDGHRIMVARSNAIGMEGYEIFLPADLFARRWEQAVEAGARPSGLLAWEIARIEAGRPEWGLDMDDNTIPQEANFDELEAISYTKGCYIGQEVVARVHFRGHVNRHLRGLLFGQNEPPPPGALLFDQSEKQVGDVRSSALSPRRGAIALAMVRREVQPGALLRARWDGSELQAEVRDRASGNAP
jgi:folate-binding protein YgfZ